MNDLKGRMIRAARLDSSLYEEVEADTSASTQAVMVVILSSLGSGIAGLGYIGIKGLILNTVVALVGWYIWAYVTYFVGTKILPEPQTSSNPGELLRTLGFASAPGVIRVIGVIQPLAGLVNFIAAIWMLITMIIAVRQALDYRGIGRAIGVCLIGWFIYALLTVVLGTLTGWSF